MNKLLITITLLFVSLNGYADCFSKTPEEMAYYAYMDENALRIDWCSCDAMFNTYAERAKEMLDSGRTQAATENLNYAKTLSAEMTKIERVLKKDYGATNWSDCTQLDS